MELLPNTTFHRLNLDSIKEGEWREGRRKEGETWIPMDCNKCSYRQLSPIHLIYSSSAQSQNGYLDEWDQSRKGDAKREQNDGEKYKV